MSHIKFVVSRFENRNGVTSWRVDGRLHGLRIRKNFKTREEAAAEQAALEVKSLQIASGMRSVATSLTEDQVREAEALFRRVAGRPAPLSFYVDFALANHREPETQKRLVEAVAEYVAAKKHEHEQAYWSTLPQRAIPLAARWRFCRLRNFSALAGPSLRRELTALGKRCGPKEVAPVALQRFVSSQEE
jgi:hypothetical protein